MKIQRCFIFGIILFLSFFLFGFSFFSDIKLSSYAQKKQHHEIIKMLQPELDQGGELSAWHLFFLGGSYYEIRDYSKALATIDLMQKRVDQGDRTIYGKDISVYVQVFRGLIYLDQGDISKAITEGQLAYKMLHEGGRDRQDFYKSQLISICDFWGVALELTGKKEKATKLIEALQSINSRGQVYAAEKYIAIARIYMAKKDYANALAAVRNPEAKVSGLLTAFYDQTFQEIPKLYILSKSLYETGNLKEAKEGYDQLLSHPQIEQIGGINWIVLMDRARIALQEGDKKSSEDMLKKAIDVIEKQRSTISTETGRIGFVGDKQAAYAELTALLIREGRYAEAFAYVERAKARALVDLLASQKNITVGGKENNNLKTTLAQLNQAENNMNIVSPADDKENTNKTRSVLLAIKKDLQEKDPGLAALVSVNTPATAEIQNKLTAEETLLEYYFAGQEWYVFVLTAGTITAQKLSVNNLTANIDALRTTIINHNSSSYSNYAQTLYSQLIAPVLPAIKTKKVIVVPHGYLHYLPFAVLTDGNQFLIDRFSIRLLPSASILGFLQAKAKSNAAGALIFGNPQLGDPRFDLKFAQDEAVAIGKIIPDSRVLLHSDASKINLQNMSSKYSIIHLAVHGVFDVDKPLNSALLLAGSDGFLKAADLYNLSLNADLVTLSACETALGKISNGDDVVGFTRGFFYAGARSLISSLWPVDDRATRDLMVDFYTNLPKMNKDDALRQAQLKVKRQYPHPFYWAAFTLTGNAL